MQEKQKNNKSHHVAIVGGGICGMVIANILAQYDIVVTVFDKGRNVAGRMSTRLSQNDSQWIFDHGVPFFEITDSQVYSCLQYFLTENTYRTWKPRAEQVATKWIGVPKMSSIVEALATNLEYRNIQTQEKVVEILAEEQHWSIQTEKKKYAGFDDVVLTIPAPQIISIAPKQERANLPDISYASAWTVLLQCERLGLRADYLQKIGIIKAAICESRKPSHGSQLDQGYDHWVLHAIESWSTEQIEADKEYVQQALLTEFSNQIHHKITPIQVQVHRWRYANVTKGCSEQYWVNSSQNLYQAGDGFCWQAEHSHKNRGVERAILSAISVSEEILRKQYGEHFLTTKHNHVSFF